MNILLPQPADAQDDYVWFTTQAALVRRALDSGALPPAIDWAGIVEELEDLGRSELRAVQSHCEVALEHLMKLACWPNHEARRQWIVSVGNGLDGAQQAWSPAMASILHIEVAHHRALRRLRILAPECGPAAHELISACPVSLADLLAASPDAPAILALAERFRAAP